MDSRSSEPFVYQPLALAKNEIRLIRLLHGVNDVPHCQLETVDLEHAPSYIALSYTWGPAAPTTHIRVDDGSLMVRQNLLNFLLAFRNDTRNTKYLWIDQISINQDQVQERNHQVRLMASIYRRASSVVVWLGCDSVMRKAAMQYDKRERALLLSYDRSSDPLATLLRHEYFSRLWVVQEVCLAAKIDLLCGTTWLSWENLAKQSLCRSAHDYLRGAQRLGLDAKKLLLEHTEQEKSKKNLRYFLTQFSRNSCEDPRDKVFGLLGLLDTETQTLTVDYAKCVCAVFSDLVTHLHHTKQVSSCLSDYNWCEAIGMALGLGYEYVLTIVAQLFKLGIPDRARTGQNYEAFCTCKESKAWERKFYFDYTKVN